MGDAGLNAEQAEIFSYDPNGNMFKVAFTYRNTAIQLCLSKAEFWFLIAVHVASVFTYRTGLELEQSDTDAFFLPWDLLGIIVKLTSFFICFYTDHCFARYLELYDQTRDLLVKLFEIVQQLRVRLPNGEKKPEITGAKRSCVRYVVLAIYLFFFWMSSKTVTDKEFDQLIQTKLLRPHEMEWLKTYKGTAHSIVLDWSLQVLSGVLGTQRNKHLRAMNAIVADIRRQQIAVEDAINMPMPFQYFHVMNLMLMINFTLWAYGMGMYKSYLASIIFVTSLLIFMGMKELSACLSDPFGDDAVDFPLNGWIQQVWMRAHFYLEADCEMVTLHPKNFEDAPPLWQGRASMDVYIEDDPILAGMRG